MIIQIFGARSVPARWSGFDTTASELAVRFAAQGHKVIVYVMPKYALPEKPRTFKGVELRYFSPIYGKNTETIFHEVICSFVGLFTKADINYVLGCRTSWTYFLYKLLNKRLVFNTDGLDFARKKWGKVARNFLKFGYKSATLLTHYHIHDNTHIQDYFVRNYSRKGVFISIGGYEYKSKYPEILKSYEVEPGEYYLIACRFEPENNIHNLIEGFIRSSSQKKLLIAGGANYKSKYEIELRKIKSEKVRFLGPVYIPYHIEELHYNCFAYLHGHEVGGTNPSLLKAMGCGNVIIANSTLYNIEVLGKENGVYFDNNPDCIAERIKYVENNYEKLILKKEEIIARLNKFYNWDYSAKLHEKYFKYMMGLEKEFEETF